MHRRSAIPTGRIVVARNESKFFTVSGLAFFSRDAANDALTSAGRIERGAASSGFVIPAAARMKRPVEVSGGCGMRRSVVAK